jgi:hypothetical protein
MQQWKPQHVFRLAQPVAASGKDGAADWKQLLGGEVDGVEARPIAVAVPDRQVHIFPCEVHVVHGCREFQLDFRMRLGEPAEPGDQPFRAKSGEVLTVIVPERWRWRRSVPSSSRSKFAHHGNSRGRHQ